MEELDITEIVKYLPHRYPFLLIDRVTSVESGVSLSAIKNVTANEPIFTGHFPQFPVFPGVLILESVQLERTRRGIWRFAATATVDEKLCCSAEVLIAKNEIEL